MAFLIHFQSWLQHLSKTTSDLGPGSSTPDNVRQNANEIKSWVLEEMHFTPEEACVFDQEFEGQFAKHSTRIVEIGKLFDKEKQMLQVIFIAGVLVGLAYVAVRAVDAQRGSQSDSVRAKTGQGHEAKPSVSTSPVAGGQAQSNAPHVLSLIVAAKHAAFAKSLRESRTLDEEQAHKLEEAHTWFWYGSKQEYQYSRIFELFHSRPEGSPENEFSIWCIAIRMKQSEQRLAVGASILQRSEAFGALPGIVEKVEVSGPHPIERLRGLPFQRV